MKNMKKLATMLLALVAAMALGLCLAGCSVTKAADAVSGGSSGGGSEKTTTTSKSKSTQVEPWLAEVAGTYYGEEGSTDDMDDWVYLDDIGITVTLTINTDGTFYYCITSDGDVIEDEGTIEYDAELTEAFQNDVEGGIYYLPMHGYDEYQFMYAEGVIMLADEGPSEGTMYFTLVR